jgi:predicted DNA-binding transcriptional regulator AlpA
VRLRFLILFAFFLVTATIDDRWLSINDLAERFNMPVQTLYDWRRRGYGPRGVRLGRGERGFIRYKLSEVQRFEREQEQAESAGAA